MQSPTGNGTRKNETKGRLSEVALHEDYPHTLYEWTTSVWRITDPPREFPNQAPWTSWPHAKKEPKVLVGTTLNFPWLQKGCTAFNTHTSRAISDINCLPQKKNCPSALRWTRRMVKFPNLHQKDVEWHWWTGGYRTLDARRKHIGVT